MNSTHQASSLDYEDVQIFMMRPDFENVHDCDLPPGYRFRPFQPGDDAIWTEIQRAAEPFNEIDDDLFERQYGSARDDLPSRMWFVRTGADKDIATISAWWEHGAHVPNDRGRIHWVAVHPLHQRRGITKPMMTLAMQRMAQSHPSAMLDTSSGRPWAVKVYLDFGFRPDSTDLTDPNRLSAWHNVQHVIEHPALVSLPTKSDT